MKFNREQYDEIVLVLENEGRFYKKYMEASTFGARRQVISCYLSYPGGGTPLPGLPSWVRNNDIEDRDQIRRYFDDRYARDQNQVNTYAHIPSVWGKPKAVVEFEFTGVKADLDAHLAVVKQITADVDKLCGIPPAVERPIYTHPEAPGRQYLKGDDGFVLTRSRPELPWKRTALSLTNNRLNEANGYVCVAAPPVHVPACPIPIPSPEYLAAWIAAGRPASFEFTPTTEETTMTKPIAITTKTFVGETDISTLADSTIYSMIAGEEAAIKELSAIENKPKRLVAEIEKRQAGILALVAHLDSKE